MTEIARSRVAEARRIVLKLGTRVVSDDDGRLALSRLFAVVDIAARLRSAGRDVLLVSSGAVGLGRDLMGLEGLPVQLEERQACAAVGQSRLMGLYEAGFSKLGVVCGQVLLTQDDFNHRDRYLNLRGTLQAMLRRGVVPVINENDAVSTEELAFVEGARKPVFGDNDRLSALVATKLDADLLVLLTDVAGVYDKNPRSHDDAELIGSVDDVDRISDMAATPGSELSRGGMKSKIEAAAIAARAGCDAVIASGLDGGTLPRLLAGDEVGTWFPAQGQLDARRRWIAFASTPSGSLHLDAGAVNVLRDRGASLLAAGVLRIDGDFRRGDVVELRDPTGDVIGRGMVYCDAATARAWCGGEPPEGVRNHDALVHRDHMVLES